MKNGMQLMLIYVFVTGKINTNDSQVTKPWPQLSLTYQQEPYCQDLIDHPYFVIMMKTYAQNIPLIPTGSIVACKVEDSRPCTDGTITGHRSGD